MSVDIRSSSRRRYVNELEDREKEIAAGLLKVSQPSSPKAVQDNEKRIRREIANSNERRRMQCINAGFSSLRALIPQLEGEKLSKAAILQIATEYISSLEKEKSRLQIQLDHTKGLLSELGQDRDVADAFVSSSPPPSKRKKRDTESSDEGVGSLSDTSDEGGAELRHENVALRHQLEIERKRCLSLEDSNRLLQTQLLSLLQAQGHVQGSLSELRPVNTDHHQLREPELLCKKEVVQVISSHSIMRGSDWYEGFHPPRPLSPTPEQKMEHEASVPLDVRTSLSHNVDTSQCAERATLTVKLETGVANGMPNSVPVPPSAEAMAPTVTAADQQQHHHNYCHRDHPRRRHRQQAMLEQQMAEEEQRIREQQEQAALATPAPFRPKSSAQNLENLVEAIRQIEGDRMLCKLYGEDHKGFDDRPNAEESERETGSVSDWDRFASESSDRDSPLQHHHHHQLQQQQKLSISSSGRLYDKNSVVTQHIHTPIYPTYYRPAVIAHKQ